MTEQALSEILIQQSGCGPFQWLIVSFVYLLVKHPAVSVTHFMSFGNYNPGTRCLDHTHYLNATTKLPSFSNSSAATHYNASSSLQNLNDVGTVTPKSAATTGYYNTNGAKMESSMTVTIETTALPKTENETDESVFLYHEYSVQSCDVFEKCREVEFNPEMSTIVSEWGLVCDNEWVSSLIISLQMFGVLIGTIVFGQMGDSYGRKITFYGCLALVGVFNGCAVFSPNWQCYAAFRFLIGFFIAAILNLYFVLPNEYLNSLWRSRVPGSPAMHTGGVLFALVAMACKDWRILHTYSAVFCLVCCIPALWVPESIRWLEVKGKQKQFEKVVRKMKKMNKMDIDLNDYKADTTNDTTLSLSSPISGYDNQTDTTKVKVRYTYIDIFRHGYLELSVILGLFTFSVSLCYFAIVFGIGALEGNIFINLIILSAIEIPFCVVPTFAPNLLGRKGSTLLCMALGTLCLFATACFEAWTSGSVKTTGTLILAVLGKTCMNAAWNISIILTTEAYPTVVRSIAICYCDLMARVGGILAPILIPSNPESVFICYLVMGFLGIGSCLMILRLPETKGKTMKETFSD